MSPALLLAALLLAQPAGDADAVAEARLAAALPAAPCRDRACAAREIATLVQLDQLHRGRLEGCFALAAEAQGPCMSAVGSAMLEQDGRNTARLRTIVERHGWPFAGWSPGAADAAWYLVQHAVDPAGEKDLALQRAALPHVSAAVVSRDLTPWHYAALRDRLLMRSKEQQLYGTQTRCENGAAEPIDLAAPETVDVRRRAIGLPPLAEALAVKTPDCAGYAS